MGEQQPEAKDGLRKHVENRVGDNLSVDIDEAAAISDTPDAKSSQYLEVSEGR